MTKEFLSAYTATVANEGSLANDKADKGGMTWKGIARNMNPGWAGWKLVDAHLAAKHPVNVIKQDTALEALVKDFYMKEYWIPLRLSEVKNQDIRNKFFDTAVNVGKVAAIKFNQASVAIEQTGKINDLLITELNNAV